MPTTTAGATRLSKANRYPATCIRCHGHVPAGEGWLARTSAGAWAADHDGDCPATPTLVATPSPAPVARVTSDGIYRDDAGTIWKVQEARQGTGRLYAKRLEVTRCTDTSCGHPTTVQPDGRHAPGHFVYEPGAIHTLRADQRLTTTDAAVFGQLYGVCACCGRDLTDETSIERGIGPVCAGKYF